MTQLDYRNGEANLQATRLEPYPVHVKRGLIGLVIVFSLHCGGDSEEPPQTNDDACLATTELPGGKKVEWHTGAACGDKQQCVFGHCICLPQCESKSLTAIQNLHLGDRGVSGLFGVRSGSLSPDGSQLIVAAELDNQITVLNAHDLTPLTGLELSIDKVTALAISPNGATILAGHSQLQLLERNTDTGALTPGATIEANLDGIRDILFVDNDNVLVASIGSVLTVLARINGQFSVTQSLADTHGITTLSAGKTSIWGASTNTIYKLESNAGEWVATASWPFEGIQDIAVTADETQLYLAGDGGLHALSTGTQLSEITPVELPNPHGITHGYSDEEPAQYQAVTLAENDTLVLASSYYGGYVLAWDRDSKTGALSNARVTDYQPAYTDDRWDLEGSGDGENIGIDPQDDFRFARFVRHNSTQGSYLLSGLWSAIGKLSTAGGTVTTEARLQQGKGGITSLGGAYAVSASTDNKHVYVAAKNSPHPSAWQRNLKTGALTPLAGPTNVGVSPIDYGMPDVKVTPNGKYVLSVDDEFNRVHVYDRNPQSGELEFRMNSSADNDFMLLISLSISPDGESVYVADFDGDQIGHLNLNPQTGEIALAESYRDGEEAQNLGGPEVVLVSPDNNFAYGITFFGASVAVFSRNLDNGTLTQIQSFQPKEGDTKLFYGMEAAAFSPDGSRLILVSPPTDRLAVCARNPQSGELSLLWSQPFKAEEQPDPGRVVVGSEGKRVYVSLRKSGSVASFNLQESGELSWQHTWTVPNAQKGLTDFTNGLALISDGRHLYATSMLGDSLTVFQINTVASGQDDGCGQ
ncbi:MAG TPA: hypothetical protein EYN06_09255, partial [Myxococcales bacterium]|nr:hypothetical protein [Myxococcales bacterium]